MKNDEAMLLMNCCYSYTSSLSPPLSLSLSATVINWMWKICEPRVLIALSLSHFHTDTGTQHSKWLKNAASRKILAGYDLAIRRTGGDYYINAE